MTENFGFIPCISRTQIYVKHESPYRVTICEFSYLTISRLWLYITQASGTDDMGSYEWSQGEVRCTIPPLTTSISLTTPLAIAFYTKTRGWASTWDGKCYDPLWLHPKWVWWFIDGSDRECTYWYSIYRWNHTSTPGYWVDQFQGSSYTRIIRLLYLYAALEGEICSLARQTIHWLWAGDPLYATTDAIWNHGD